MIIDGAIFNREITATEILAESSHQKSWQINGGATAPLETVHRSLRTPAGALTIPSHNSESVSLALPIPN